ncbi:MAG: copper chaperone PCu(A)C [Betaproteobacteria bacterium]|nr:copper chaperone PCu(A)C [Betaproteobacteria bacterium]
MICARLLLVSSLLLALPAFAQSPAPATPAKPAKKMVSDHVPVKISQAWARVTAPGANTGAVYMKVEASSPVQLVQAESDVSKSAELHEMKMADGVMQMRPISPIEMGPGKPVEFKPGGYHIMLLQLKRPIAAGDLVPVRLTFVKPDNQIFTTSVAAIGAEKAPGKN